MLFSLSYVSGMVSQFPQDYMHLVLLGVVRKMIYTWMQGPLRMRVRTASIAAMSDRMLSYRVHWPSDFQRKPRSFTEVKNWKATEFRSFLCYLAAVVLRGILDDDVYQHFCLLITAMRILLNKQLCATQHAFAGRLLKTFVDHVPRLYDDTLLTYNMHGLVHLSEEGALHGCLDNISCFPFESYLYQIKRLLRRPGATLQQVVYRTLERRRLDDDDDGAQLPLVQQPHFVDQHCRGPVPRNATNFRQYTTCTHNNVRLSVKQADCCVEIGGDIGVIVNILEDGAGQPLAVLRLFSDDRDVFNYPVPSRTVGFHRVSGLSHTLHVRPFASLNKCILLAMSRNVYAAVALNHVP